MKPWAVMLSATYAFLSLAHAQPTEIKAGQTWSANVPSAPNLRVFIGKIDDETTDIIHISLSGLPNIERNPSVLEELSQGKPVVVTHTSCVSCLSNIEDDFYFSYDIAPNFTHEAVTLRVLYVPIDRTLLTPDLNSVLESNGVATPSFESSWNSWDYLRDSYGVDHEASRIAKLPLADIIRVATRTARGHLKFLEENKNEIGQIDEKVRFEVTVEPIEPRQDNNN